MGPILGSVFTLPSWFSLVELVKFQKILATAIMVLLVIAFIEGPLHGLLYVADFSHPVDTRGFLVVCEEPMCAVLWERLGALHKGHRIGLELRVGPWLCHCLCRGQVRTRHGSFWGQDVV